MPVIYMIENSCNDIKYIGYSKHDADTRLRNHIAVANNPNKGSKLHKAMRLLGCENFSCKVLEEGDDISMDDEIRWIKTVSETHPLYNETVGGAGRTGCPHTAEAKAKVSEGLSGERHYLYGKKHREETIAKMKKAQTGKNNGFYGKTHTQDVRDKVAEAAKVLGDPCEWCGKIVTRPMRKRWHGDNCSKKPK
ncbi:SegD [Vibrio phage vB_VcorM_GR28A]|nr:SegD [Vibrio phage vB_VcorM_GR28A]